MLKGGKQRQPLREDQRLANQSAEIERLTVELLLEQINDVYHAQ